MRYRIRSRFLVALGLAGAALIVFATAELCASLALVNFPI